MNIEKQTYFGYMILTLVAIASILLGLALSVSEAHATPFNLIQGEYQITGNAYIDNDYNQGTSKGARGIAEIYTVSQGSNEVWNRATASNEYNLYFDGYTVINTAPIGSDIVAFESIGGYVSIYDNLAGTFQATGNYWNDASAITAGSLYLYLTGNGNTSGFIVSNQGVPISILATGLLNVIGGPESAYFDTNLLPNGADMSFSLSGDNTDTSGYTFSGSSDLGGVAPVPSPAPLALMGLGLIAMRRVVKSKQV